LARQRARVERAATLHRRAVAITTAAMQSLDGYSPASAPAEQYAHQHDLAGRLRAVAAELVPGWLGAPLDAVPASTPLGDADAPTYLRIGQAHPLDDARFPVIVPLLGRGHLAIDADARDPRVAGLVRSLVLRLLAAARAGTVRVRVVDAASDGETTVAFGGIPALMSPPRTDHAGLLGVLSEAEQWVRTPRGTPSVGAHWQAPTQVNEPQPAHHVDLTPEYLLIVIASLPELTDGTDLNRIGHLAKVGPAVGLHLIAAGWPPPPLTAETTQAPLPHSTQVALRNPYAWVGDPPGATYSGDGVGPGRLNAPVYLDPDPPVELVRRVCGQLASAPPPDEPPTWTVAPQRWSEYVQTAQGLDAVRREAAAVVNAQTSAVLTARDELAALRARLAAQQARLEEAIKHIGKPVPLVPGPAELASARSELGRLPGRGVPRPRPVRRADQSVTSAPPAWSGSVGTTGQWSPATTRGLPAVNPAAHRPSSPAPGAAPRAGDTTGSTPPIGPAPSPYAPGPVLPVGTPSVPDRALAAVTAAREALDGAAAALSGEDRADGWPPELRNALVYGAFAMVFALAQIPLLAAITASLRPPLLVAVPLGLLLVPVSFALGWLTLGLAYRPQARHSRVARTPLLGAAISLLAAAPVIATALWQLAAGFRS
jgi:hypothetical protein